MPVYLQKRIFHAHLIGVIDDIRQPVDNRKRITASVLFDLSKAFDMIQHDLFLQKMKDKGSSSTVLSWIHAYLNNIRSQAVKDSQLFRHLSILMLVFLKVRCSNLYYLFFA